MEEKEILEKISYFLDDLKEKRLIRKIEQFHEKRMEKIKNNKTTAALLKSGKIVFQLIPIESFKSPKYYDILICKDLIRKLRSSLLNWECGYNFDGLLYIQSEKEKNRYSYFQFYINGIIEAVDYSFFRIDKEINKKIISIFKLEEKIVQTLKECLNFQQNLGISLPLICYLDLLDVKDYRIIQNFNNKNSIDREDLNLPKIIIDKFDIIPEKILKTNFDRIWNACDYPRSEHYNEKDEWIKV